MLDSTYFYPQGGGQPADNGMINSVFVSDVRLQSDGTVYHYTDTCDDLEIGNTVQCSIDNARRSIHRRLHSAGHMIDIAFYNACKDASKAYPKPTKGYHFSDGAYVEYDMGDIKDDYTTLVDSINTELKRLIESDIKIHCYNLSDTEALSKGIVAPVGKKARWVEFEGYELLGCGCGGTHTRSTKEIDHAHIVSIAIKKGILRIRYAL